MLHTFKHYTVVGGVERSLAVRIHHVDDFDVDFCVFHHHDATREGFVNSAEEAEIYLDIR
jgi:hypothetical protein